MKLKTLFALAILGSLAVACGKNSGGGQVNPPTGNPPGYYPQQNLGNMRYVSETIQITNPSLFQSFLSESGGCGRYCERYSNQVRLYIDSWNGPSNNTHFYQQYAGQIPTQQSQQNYSATIQAAGSNGHNYGNGWFQIGFNYTIQPINRTFNMLYQNIAGSGNVINSGFALYTDSRLNYTTPPFQIVVENAAIGAPQLNVILKHRSYEFARGTVQRVQ